MQIINISDPTNIVATDAETDGVNGFTELDGALGVDTFTIGSNTYAIVTSRSDDGIQMIQLSVLSNPSQVGTVSPTAGNTQVQLSWSAPDNGGASITDYIIQYSTDNSTWSTFSDGTSTTTSSTVTGLTNGQQYYFKVAAVNSVGTGTYSEVSSMTTLISNEGSAIIKSVSLEHDTTSARHNSLIQVDSDTFALAYAGPGTDGYITTFTISSDGTTITKVATLEHDSRDASYNSLVQVDSDTFALAYAGRGDDGYITTFTISSDGTTITKVATLEHDTSNNAFNSLVQVDSDTYALAYTGDGSDGYISTFTISSDGTTITKVATLEHDAAYGIHNSLVKVDSDTFALAYQGDRTRISTFTISADGSSITEIASIQTGGSYNSLVQVDSDTFALAYTGGNIKTFTIPSNGATITEVASIDHETSRTNYNSLVKVDSDTYALAYTGDGYDGYITTFTISGSTAPDAVGTVTPTAGNHQVQLSWNAPSNGGSPITDYIIQYSADNSTWYTYNDGTSTGTTATLTGLNNGLQFYFKVAAVNDVGTGSYSSAVTATPNTVPSKVGFIAATPAKNTISLSWDAPSNDGTAITDYIIMTSLDNTSWSVFSDGTSTATTATIPGLTKDTTCYIKIAAVNAAGTGVYSNVKTVKTAGFDTNHQFTEKSSFESGKVFGSGTRFAELQEFSGVMEFGVNQIFAQGTKFADSQEFSKAQTFGDAQEFGSGGTFAAANTWGEKADFSAGTQVFSTAQTFGASAKFAPNQDFTNVDHDFTAKYIHFDSGTRFSAGEMMGAGADFTAGIQVFGAGMTFGEATEFADSQDWGADSHTFDKYMHFGKANDFADKIQIFKEGTSFGVGTMFADSQTLPPHTIPSFGILLDEITCGTDTTENTCMPTDASKYLHPGEFLIPGQDPAATSTSISSTDKSFALEGAGLEMSFGTVTGDGTIVADLYDPANIPASTAVGDTGKVSVTTTSGDVETIGSVTDISTGTATISGDITITLSYSEANIPAGTAESELTMIHYTGGQWITEPNCTVDETNNTISCTVTSLSPFGVGGSSSSSSGSSGSSGKSCNSKGFGMGKSLMVHEVNFSESSNVVTLKVQSTCGTITSKVMTDSGFQSMKLSLEQPYLDDNIAVYSVALDDTIEDFTVLVNNKKNTFDQKFYPHGSDLIRTYTGDTKYTSTQQGTQNVSAYTSDQQGVTADSVVSVDVTPDEKVVTHVADTMVDEMVDTMVNEMVDEMAHEMVYVQEPTPQYIPEPVGDTIVPSSEESIPEVSYVPEPIESDDMMPLESQYIPEPTPICGVGTVMVDGYCVVLQNEPSKLWWKFW